MVLRLRLPAHWRDHPGTALVLLALALLIPMGIAVGFVGQAVATQSAAARREVLESYRAQLRLVRTRVDAHWRVHAASLDGPEPPGRRFARLIRDGMADGAVIVNVDGTVAYPDVAVAPSAAATVLDRRLNALERRGERAGGEAIESLAAALDDYTLDVAASERLALMTRLRALAPNVVLPTEAALRLSMTLRTGGHRAASPGHFQPSAIRDVWALTSADGQVVALYWTGRIEAMMHDLLHDVAPAGIRFLTYPPDATADPEAIAAGVSLPGWQLTFQPLDRTTFDAAARRKALASAAVAGGGITIMAIAGLGAVRSFRRHLRLARMKTDLVAAVSHELRTPLASMRVLVDGLLDDERLDPVKTREYLELLSSENARLTRLIDNFLRFSRLERGRHQFVFGAWDAASILGEAVCAVRDRLPPGCRLDVEVEPDLPPLVADRDAIVTAMVNLVDNAVKYTPADKRIVLRAGRDGTHAIALSVADNGIGIEPREQRRIFRRFYRVDQRLASDTTGVGLGLSIVDHIIRAHGGTVAVTSAIGSGSTFTLRLPCGRDGVAA